VDTIPSVSASNPSSETPEFNARQKAFIKAYAVCRNGSEAARLAGYSVPSANRIATRLLSNVRIREAADREMGWEFEDWCKSVKGIFHDEKQWQAKVRSLELYGKAKGWLRDSLEVGVNIVQLALDDVRQSRSITSLATYNTLSAPTSNSLPANDLQK